VVEGTRSEVRRRGEAGSFGRLSRRRGKLISTPGSGAGKRGVVGKSLRVLIAQEGVLDGAGVS
jgi:hypothetical protein